MVFTAFVQSLSRDAKGNTSFSCVSRRNDLPTRRLHIFRRSLCIYQLIHFRKSFIIDLDIVTTYFGGDSIKAIEVKLRHDLFTSQNISLEGASYSKALYKRNPYVAICLIEIGDLGGSI